MDPKLWGPSAWKTLHALAIEADRRKSSTEFYNYIQNLASLLPCEACRGHMQSYLQIYPVPAENMFQYTVQFHNHVNKRLGKREVSYEEALEMWHSSACAKCEPEEKLDYTSIYILISLVIFFILYGYYRTL